jgi:hypothetical protein
MEDVTQLDLEEALLLDDDEQRPSDRGGDLPTHTNAISDADVLAVIRGARAVDW